MQQLPKLTNSYGSPVWNQINDSDLNGSIYSSFNINVSENEGTLAIGERLVVNTNTADVANLASYPVDFKLPNFTSGDKIWTVAGTRVFHQAEIYPNGSGFTQDATSGTPTNCSSSLSLMEVFNGTGVGNTLFVSTDTGMSYLVDGGTWSTFSPPFGGGANPTPMAVYGNRLYVANAGNAIYSCNQSFTSVQSGAYTITALPFPSLQITFMKTVSDGIWIGTLNYIGDKGYMFKWDGVATQINKAYKLESAGALACVIKNDVPIIMDTNAELSQFNGGTFEKLPNGHFNRRNKKMLINALSTVNNRFIHPNGMSLVNGVLTILIDGRNHDNSTASSSTIEETIPSGLYEYDPSKGLIHKHSVATAHSIDTIQDYGAAKIAGAGGLSEWNILPTPAVSTRNGTMLVGAAYYADATTIKGGVFYNDSNDTLQKAGYFISTKLPAMGGNGLASIQNTWQKLHTLYKNLLNSTDKIVVKYRLTELPPVEATITWTSTTTFTVLNSAVTVSDYWTADTGGEVEILSGFGAGRCSHITNAVNNAGTWTVTVDETYTGATSQTAKGRFQKWIKLGSISYNASTSDGVTYDSQTIGKVSNWIQFKVWMLFTGPNELEKLLITNDNHNPPN